MGDPNFDSNLIPQLEARIAVIDNNESLRDLSIASLQKEGWQALGYSYTQIDLAAVEQHRPNLIILDFDLADEEIGWEFLQLLKMNDETAKIPILITTTSFQLPPEVQSYLLTRYIGIIRKPFDPATFLMLIRKTLRESSQSGALFSGDRTLPILLVDDNQDLRDATATILRLESYRVVTAYDGLVALDSVSRAEFSLILLDLDMPKMNGYEFLSAYDQQLRPHVPVIIVSGDGIINFRILPTFVVDVLPKPFYLRRLMEMVSKYAQTV